MSISLHFHLFIIFLFANDWFIIININCLFTNVTLSTVVLAPLYLTQSISIRELLNHGYYTGIIVIACIWFWEVNCLHSKFNLSTGSYQIIYIMLIQWAIKTNNIYFHNIFLCVFIIFLIAFIYANFAFWLIFSFFHIGTNKKQITTDGPTTKKSNCFVWTGNWLNSWQLPSENEIAKV